MFRLLQYFYSLPANLNTLAVTLYSSIAFYPKVMTEGSNTFASS